MPSRCGCFKTAEWRRRARADVDRDDRSGQPGALFLWPPLEPQAASSSSCSDAMPRLRVRGLLLTNFAGVDCLHRSSSPVQVFPLISRASCHLESGGIHSTRRHSAINSSMAVQERVARFSPSHVTLSAASQKILANRFVVQELRHVFQSRRLSVVWFIGSRTSGCSTRHLMKYRLGFFYGCLSCLQCGRLVAIGCRR